MTKNKSKLYEKQIQGSDVAFRTTISLDERSKRMFDMLNRYAQEILGMNLSSSTLIRRAIEELWLSTLEQIVNAYDNSETVEERMERLMKYHEFSRQKFLEAAGK